MLLCGEYTKIIKYAIQSHSYFKTMIIAMHSKGMMNVGTWVLKELVVVSKLF